MNFTWFASAFDTDDDALYRLLTMLQMGGVLLLGAGVPEAFNDGDYLGVTLGFIVSFNWGGSCGWCCRRRGKIASTTNATSCSCPGNNRESDRVS
ncbi:low temperature requirement protein LtrA [Arthrobacter globiformis]|nr:low temperature requirement protein LtrA [Arthrobacter globiformis]